MKAIKLGDKGNKVTICQAIVNMKIDTKIDGNFGIQTEDNIALLQKNYYLKPDGIVGQKTLELLLTILKNNLQKIMMED